MRIFMLAVAVLSLAVAGCGSGGPDVVPVHGKVMWRGRPVADGEVRFIPTGQTKGPASVGNIVAGEYKIDARGGVPVGTHRIEIRIIGRTGADTGSGVMSTEGAIGSIGPPVYDSPDSPLTCEVTSNEDTYDFDIP
jgi:hypothetical protein